MRATQLFYISTLREESRAMRTLRKNEMRLNWGWRSATTFYSFIILSRPQTRNAFSTDQEQSALSEYWIMKFKVSDVAHDQACPCRNYLWLNWRWDIWTGEVPVLMSQLQTWPDIRPLASTEGSRGLNSLTTMLDGASSAIQGLLGLSAHMFSWISHRRRSSIVWTRVRKIHCVIFKILKN